MKITSVQSFILHVPVTGGGIADSTHNISHWGVVGAAIQVEGGLTGYGFTGTHAFLPGDQLITRCIDTCLAPLLLGQDAGAPAILERVMHICVAHALRANGPSTYQPRATPWVIGNKKIKALEGRHNPVAPLQGFVFSQRNPRALPWAGMVRTVGAEEPRRIRCAWRTTSVFSIPLPAPQSESEKDYD